MTKRDHPRVCGEKRQKTKQHNKKKGSPPRVRGKAERLQFMKNADRITPACAGKRYSNFRFDSCCKDHPCVCGEKSHRPLSSPFSLGSPPRMRGKGERIRSGTLAQGITPACAGKRNSWAVHWTIQRDHPRMCGEKLVEAGRISQEEGSPPRMRGKGPAGQILVVSVGITPARAGKSVRRENSSS